MTVKADFLISPAYIVPTMITSIRWRWTRIAVPVRVPSVAGAAVGLGEGVVDVAPPDLRLRGRLDDDELVLRGAPGVLAGFDDERPVGGEEALALPEGELVQFGGR